jgi:ribosomal protein L37AE/L43A
MKYKCQSCGRECGVLYYDDIMKLWKCQRCAYENKKLQKQKEKVKTN